MYKYHKEMCESIHFDHEIIYYVPIFKLLPGDPHPLIPNLIHESYPSFTIAMEMASTDEQMAWSFEPDEVLILKGNFNFKSKPWFDSDVYWTHGNGD